jgi:hypothetical protein
MEQQLVYLQVLIGGLMQLISAQHLAVWFTQLHVHGFTHIAEQHTSKWLWGLGSRRGP